MIDLFYILAAIFTVTLCWTFLFLLLKIIKLVFSTFNDNLFAASHNVTFSNSWFMVLLRVLKSWWLRNRFVSSANKINWIISQSFYIYHFVSCIHSVMKQHFTKCHLFISWQRKTTITDTTIWFSLSFV